VQDWGDMGGNGTFFIVSNGLTGPFHQGEIIGKIHGQGDLDIVFIQMGIKG